MVIGSFIDLRIIEPSFDERKGKKRKFHCGAVCNAQACTVIQISLFRYLASSYEIEEPFILYHQGNAASTL